MNKRIKHSKISVGDRFQNSKGEWFTVTLCTDSANITVKFDERDYVKRTTARSIREGSVPLPTYYEGMELTDKNGRKVKVVSIKTTNAITFQWEDGTTRVCASSVVTLNQLVHPEDSQRLTPRYPVGYRGINNQGCGFEVIAFNNCNNIVVRFDSPYTNEATCTADAIKKGHVPNNYYPSVCGIGFRGDSKVSTEEKSYKVWASMLYRVYTPKDNNEIVNYGNCVVDKSWHNFGNFVEWYNNQINGDGWQIDKDLLCKGNRIYSERTCLFLPKEINTFLTDRHHHRGDYPLGVSVNPYGNFPAHCSIDGVLIHLGTFYSEEDAFAAYKTAKEEHAKDLANKWKGTIDERACLALMNFCVDIGD